MRKIKLITDSTSDLSKELLKENDIEVIPLYVNFKEDTFKDGVDITTAELYKKVEEYGVLPKTAAINQMTFLEVFEKWYNLDYDIIYMGISKALSRSFENAFLAAREIDETRIKVIDSMNLSTGIGLLLLRASKYIKASLPLENIVNNLKNDVLKVRSQFTIPTMEYLYKGGRCTGIQKFFGTMLKIKPIIVVRNGSMQVGPKPRGKMKIALDALLKMLDLDKDNVDDNNPIFVTHSMADEDATYLETEVKKRYPNTPIYVTEAGCVISSHCGKGTIGILYMLK